MKLKNTPVHIIPTATEKLQLFKGRFSVLIARANSDEHLTIWFDYL